MKAETNGYTQSCDKCHELVRPHEGLHRFEALSNYPAINTVWYDVDGTFLNQVCPRCHLALRLEGVL